MNDNLAYCRHLFDESTDGYIHVMQINDEKTIKVYNINQKALKLVLEETKGNKDVFISSNTYYKPERSVNNIRQFRALYIDIDLKRYDKAETIYMIYELVENRKIPMPSMVIDSGRGVHLYWRIKNAPYGAIQTWQEIEDYLYHQLKNLGADIKATDGARVLRLPSTVNSRNNVKCNLLVVNDDLEYSMYDLREVYLKCKTKRAYQLEIEQAKHIKNKTKAVITQFFNSYTLHLARIEDIKKLCELRNYEVEGYRNFILHCFAYWSGIYKRDHIELENEVIELNNSFKKPLKDAEVRAILKCVPKAIDKFIAYEQGLRSGQASKVTKGMKDKGGYWYKNETLIATLDIVSEEQQHLKTIIDLEEKYRRNNAKRTPRNEEGLTKKQEELREIKEMAIKWRKSGMTIREVADALGISKSKADRLIK